MGYKKELAMEFLFGMIVVFVLIGAVIVGVIQLIQFLGPYILGIACVICLGAFLLWANRKS